MDEKSLQDTDMETDLKYPTNQVGQAACEQQQDMFIECVQII